MTKLKVSEVKGRPMLNWVGKKAINIEENYPAQLVETFNNDEKEIKLNYKELAKDNFKNWSNLLFHGDNIEVLTNLLNNGFRSKIDLIYIDPPFDSKADYIRKVELRGEENKNKLEGEGHNKIEQKQYFDIWKNDDYLQFMYERLILLKELLSDKGSIYLHCDWHKSHHLRCLLDEVFGEENFVNEVIWQKLSSAKTQSKFFSNVKDNIYIYKKSENIIFNPQFYKSNKDDKNYPYIEKETGRRYGSFDFSQTGIGPARKFGNKILFPPDGKHWIWSQEKIDKAMEEKRIIFTSNGKPRIKRYLDNKQGNYLGDLWSYDINPLSANSMEREDYPTQKPEALLERIIKASSNEDSIIFDCFMGSGTTMSVAQKLNRKWIGADINKGAIQTTAKRVQKIVKEQSENLEKNNFSSFAHFKVNDYDLQILRTEAIELAFEKLGIEKTNDNFFDGVIGNHLVKIIEINHPFSLPHFTDIQEELKLRKEEDRNIKIVCLGQREDTKEKIKEWNKKSVVNQFEIINLEDKKFMIHEPCQAQIEITKEDETDEGDNYLIEIKNFISPTILKRLSNQDSLEKTIIKDFRNMIDCVLIDNDYDGKVFNIVYSDVPKKKKDLVKGNYKITVKDKKNKIAIKIIDILGEEIVKKIKK